MSRFDEEPDGDPHGECALEIVRLQSERDQYYKCFLAEQTEHAKAIAARDNAERELASLRQKQVLWEAGNRELADRLEARDVAIDALRAEKERAEYAKILAIQQRNEWMLKLERAEAERDAALKDAALWRKHSDVVKATYVPGALHVRVTMSAEASRTEKCWQVEYVISTDEMESGVLKNHIIGMKTEQKVAELFAAIDAARKGKQ